MARKIACVDRRRCAACGVCMKECPKGAIQIWKGCWADVDTAKCVGCGKCGKVCPVGCIFGKTMEVPA